jgi:hypothetical protein
MGGQERSERERSVLRSQPREAAGACCVQRSRPREAARAWAHHVARHHARRCVRCGRAQTHLLLVRVHARACVCVCWSIKRDGTHPARGSSRRRPPHERT